MQEKEEKFLMPDKTEADFSKIDQIIEDSYPEMEKALTGLLRIPSVKGKEEENAPFGKAIKEALDYCLNLTSQMGLLAENIDGYIGVADIPGNTEEEIGVLGHIDVVPANPEDWEYAPYEPAIINGRIYARGTLDDKGPIIAALFGAMALKKYGLKLNKTVRFMFGCDEESGFSCIKHFLEVRQQPQYGFSPDACFPLVIGEKGQGSYKLKGRWDENEGRAALKLISLNGGTAGNVVPSQAQAVFEISGPFNPALFENSGLKFEQRGNKITFTAAGKAAHASLPQEGENALAKLLAFLAGLDFAPKGAKKYLNTLARLFEESGFGISFGIANEDELSRLTNIPSVLKLNPKEGSLACDLRFPVTHKSGDYYKKISAICRENELIFDEWKANEPLYVSKDSPLAETLLNAYQDLTGDMSEPLVIGGGTYAKSLKNFLAFGPAFADTPGLAHQADEYITIAELLKCAKIYARAIYGLAK